MLSSNLPSMQSTADKLISGAKDQCQKIFIPNKTSEDKEALIVDDESGEDNIPDIDNTQIVSTGVEDLFFSGQDVQCHGDETSTNATVENDPPIIESIGFPSNTVPDAGNYDNEEKDEGKHSDELLLNFD